MAEQVERLAHHALRGEVWDKALAYCRQAGEKALARSAHREAVGYFEQALSALRIYRSSATRASRPSTSGSPCARRSFRSGDSGRILACAARGRSPSLRPSTTRVGWDRSLRFLSHPFPQWACT